MPDDGGAVPKDSGAGRDDAAAFRPLCDALPALGSRPVIDGVVEAGLRLEDFSGGTWYGSYPNQPTLVSGSYTVAWHADGVYFYAEVLDPTRTPTPPPDSWIDGPGVELFVDSDGRYANAPAYDDPGTAHFIVVAPLADDGPLSRAGAFIGADYLGTGTSWTSTLFAAFPKSSGYAVEAFVVRQDLRLTEWRPAPATRVGFDIAINAGCDLGPCQNPKRSGQLALRTAEQTSDCFDCIFPAQTVAAFCNPELLP
jgi:hypothetical protein